MNPLRTLQPIAQDLWVVDDWQPVGPGVVFPSRMVVVRLPDGGLWLHSPIAIDPALAAAIDALGTVRAVVEPNLFHHLHAEAAARQWPAAELLGLPGHAAKQKAVQFASLDDAVSRWKPEIDTLAVRGIPTLEERVFFHVPTATLLVTDLVFNIHEPRGFAMPWLLRAVGAHRRFAQSRSVRFMTRDRQAAAESARAILAWPIERVVMSHGEIVATDAHSVLESALERMLAR